MAMGEPNEPAMAGVIRASMRKIRRENPAKYRHLQLVAAAMTALLAVSVGALLIAGLMLAIRVVTS